MKEKELSEKKQKLIAAGGVALFIILSIAAFFVFGGRMLAFFSDPESLREMVSRSGIVGRLLFLGMMTLQVIVAVIPGEPMEIAAGYAFGSVEGTILCLIGIAAGSGAVFLFVRRYGTRAAEIFFTKEKLDSLGFLRATKRMTWILFLICLIPGTPKDLIAYYAGLTDLKFHVWMIITVTARLPSVVSSTVSGDALGLKNYLLAGAIIVITAAASAAGMLIYKKLSNKQDGDRA